MVLIHTIELADVCFPVDEASNKCASYFPPLLFNNPVPLIAGWLHKEGTLNYFDCMRSKAKTSNFRPIITGGTGLLPAF